MKAVLPTINHTVGGRSSGRFGWGISLLDVVCPPNKFRSCYKKGSPTRTRQTFGNQNLEKSGSEPNNLFLSFCPNDLVAGKSWVFEFGPIKQPYKTREDTLFVRTQSDNIAKLCLSVQHYVFSGLLLFALTNSRYSSICVVLVESTFTNVWSCFPIAIFVDVRIRLLT